MSPAVATTFMLKCYEYCYDNLTHVVINNVLVLFNATFVQVRLSDAQCEFAFKFRSNIPASELSLDEERMLYFTLIRILSM